MQIPKWLLFIPQLPASPSSPRVKIWRDLRAAGAISLQNGVWILPHSTKHENLMQGLLTHAEKNKGGGNLMVAESLSKSEHDKIIHQFNLERQEEYEELIEHSENFLNELEHVITKQKFTHAELEESENNLKRLQKWIKTIRARDHLKQITYQQAKKILRKCKSILEKFAQQNYAQET